MPLGRFSSKIYPGARFHRLTVMERIPGGKGKRARVRCSCDCGRIIEPDCSNLTNGNTKSCGCLNKEKQAARAREKSATSAGYGQIVPGARYGRLLVLERIQINGLLTSQVKCLCDCGKNCIRTIDGMVYGRTKSCGCLSSEVTAARNTETGKYEGFSGRWPRTWARWASMMSRCYTVNATSYTNYGGKGVVVCAYLRRHPKHLLSIIGPWKNALPSLDRYPIHNGNYTCGRCKECRRNGWELNIRWATRKQQSLNRGDFNVYIIAFGITQTKSQWMELSGLSWSCITRRLQRGWTAERSMTTPDRRGNCYRPVT